MFSIVFQHLIYTFFGIIIGCGETKYFDFHTVVFMVILFVTVNFVRISQGCSLYKTFSRNVASADSEGTASNSAALPRRKDAWTISVSPQPGSSRAGWGRSKKGTWLCARRLARLHTHHLVSSSSHTLGDENRHLYFRDEETDPERQSTAPKFKRASTRDVVWT